MAKKDLLKDMFTQELSDQERATLTAAVENAASQIIFRNKSIFLDGFGILSPQVEKGTTNLSHNGKNIKRTSKFSRLTFQKCNELTSFVREKNPLIIEEKEFAEVVYSKLPVEIQVKWQLALTRKYLSGFIELLKHEVITQGFSQRLKGLGEFYALHNRQGSQFNDWYAGANIIFKSNFDQEISCEECKIYEKPVLENAWELMTCIYGKPVHIFSINLERELSRLGLDLDLNSLSPDSKPQTYFQVAIFANKVGTQQQLIYCSEGLRLLALKNPAYKNSCGNELVFQISYDSDFRESSKNSSLKLDDIVLPDWPKTVFVMGWIMLQSSKTKSLKISGGLSFNAKLCPDVPQSRLAAVFATKYFASQSEQDSPEGKFSFINLVGICEDEYKLAESYSANHLSTLLKFKRLDQVTKVCRPSILTRTAFLDLQTFTPQAPASESQVESHSNGNNASDMGL